jgi:hypothetical protein
MHATQDWHKGRILPDCAHKDDGLGMLTGPVGQAVDTPFPANKG